MGLHRFKPTPSGRMGVLWTLSTVKDAAVVEFGCMGHMLYSGVTLKHAAVYDGCHLISTHIDETDISLGHTDRLLHTVENVIKSYQPKVIFLTPSSIPEVIGTDLKAAKLELEMAFPAVKFVTFGSGGFNVTLKKGVEQTLLTLAREMPKPMIQKVEKSYNLIGSCADIFRFHEDAREIKRLMEGTFGMKPNCVMTSETSVEDLEGLGRAQINIVIRHEGVKAAEALQNQFETPFVVGRPYGIKGTVRFLETVASELGVAINQNFIEEERKRVFSQLLPIMPKMKHLVRMHPDEGTLTLGGHVDVVKGILNYGVEEFSLKRGECWCDDPAIIEGDVIFYDELKWSQIVKAHQKGVFMGSGEALTWKGMNLDNQIANPDVKWRLHSNNPPFVGFYGAVHLAEIWINSTEEA